MASKEPVDKLREWLKNLVERAYYSEDVLSPIFEVIPWDGLEIDGDGPVYLDRDDQTSQGK